jgi:hypothetical protein
MVQCGQVYYLQGSSVILLGCIGILLAVIGIAYFVSSNSNKIRKILYETGHGEVVMDLDKATRVWKVLEGYVGED